MKINEIFKSIQGEGRGSGKVTTFVRLSGCNLKCDYCDTDFEDYVYQQPYQVLQQIEELKCKEICITGGEPLLDKVGVLDLCQQLCRKGYQISIETNGTIDIRPFKEFANITMDVKCPSSGIENYGFTFVNYTFLRSTDSIKFVIESEEDYRFMIGQVEVIKSICKSIPIYVSPVFDSCAIKWLPKKIIEDNLSVIFMLQLHKLVNVK